MAETGRAEMPDVEALTRRMVGGDEAAYRVFYDAYFDRLCRYLLVVGGGNEDAMRAALQTTLVRVVRHIKVFRSEAKFWSWLTVLARSAFRDETRRRRRYLAFPDRFAKHARTEADLPETTTPRSDSGCCWNAALSRSLLTSGNCWNGSISSGDPSTRLPRNSGRPRRRSNPSSFGSAAKSKTLY